MLCKVTEGLFLDVRASSLALKASFQHSDMVRRFGALGVEARSDIRSLEGF